MSVTIEQASADALTQDPPAGELASWPRLLEGTEPIGQGPAGSGLREPL